MAYPAPPATTRQPSSTVEISVSCEKLLDLDVLSKSDPMVVLFQEPGKGQQWVELGRTERMKNNLNPKFTKTFKMQYYFEMVQDLVFRVYDVDSKTTNLEKQEYIGEVRTTMAQLVSSRNGVFRKELNNPAYPSRRNGDLIVTTVEITKPETLKIQLHGKNLDKKDFFGKSDPYIKVYRILDLNTQPPKLALVYQSEIIKNNLNPSWNAFHIEINKLLGSGDDVYSRPFYVECYDWDKDSTHDIIGSAKIVLADLLAQKTNYTVDLINSKKQAKSGYKNSGQLFATQVELIKEFSFLDYLSSGTEVSFGVAIDFTASNGEPSRPGTLHYIHPSGAPNDYMKAIWSVGHVIMPYDTDKNFPVFGFGAQFTDGKVYHDFHVNFNPANPEVHGVEGILQAYQNCIRSVALYGPTNFAPIIRKMSTIAAEASRGPHPRYFVLLIITDGEISDFDDTKDAIVAASELPLSIVIVGVGSADFSCMDDLDSDRQALKDRFGKKAARDIVQFVPFRQFQDPVYGPDLLAREVLAEVPTQVVAYMKSKGIKPAGH
ncbi:Copine-domain-containing protein [Paraphysoderma sedebokerense]|nr:Copine-domain-containing protein [Paraphysoderma sedebokerense]